MLLTIDVGNTQTVLGLFDNDQLAASWRLTTERRRTVDELRMAIAAIMSLDGYPPNLIEGIAISSVVPAVTTALREVAEQITQAQVMVVGPGTKTGMPILIDNPKEVGADRVVNSVAALEKYGAPVVVVDFGTSTNFDVVGPDGSYLGGVISPGLEVSTDALIGRTAALRRVEFEPPRSVIGKGTVEAIQAGALYGHAGLVDGIFDRIAGELGEVTRVATGGLASTIVPHCRTVDVIDEHLTLEGLRILYHRNHER